MWWPEEQQVNKKVAGHQMSSNLNLTTYVKIAQKMSEDRKYNSIQPYVYAKLYQGITNIKSNQDATYNLHMFFHVYSGP